MLSFFYGHEYGEILICSGIVSAEAQKNELPLDYYMTWMMLHGMLHLIGIHHEESAMTAARVDRLERRILAKLFFRG